MMLLLNLYLLLKAVGRTPTAFSNGVKYNLKMLKILFGLK